MNKFLTSALAIGLAIGSCMGTVQAHQPIKDTDNPISIRDVDQFYNNMAIKVETLLNYAPGEVETAQLEQISDEIMHHISEKAVMKFSFVGVHDQKLTMLGGGKFTYAQYKDMLPMIFEDPRNVTMTHNVDQFTDRGEKAIVHITHKSHYDMKKDQHDDLIKANWHVVEEAKCEDHLRRHPETQQLEIEYSNCKSRVKISGVDIIDSPDFMGTISKDDLTFLMSPVIKQ